jgi:hypothetical protein
MAGGGREHFAVGIYLPVKPPMSAAAYLTTERLSSAQSIRESSELDVNPLSFLFYKSDHSLYSPFTKLLPLANDPTFSAA